MSHACDLGKGRWKRGRKGGVKGERVSTEQGDGDTGVGGRRWPDERGCARRLRHGRNGSEFRRKSVQVFFCSVAFCRSETALHSLASMHVHPPFPLRRVSAGSSRLGIRISLAALLPNASKATLGSKLSACCQMAKIIRSHSSNHRKTQRRYQIYKMWDALH